MSLDLVEVWEAFKACQEKPRFQTSQFLQVSGNPGATSSSWSRWTKLSSRKLSNVPRAWSSTGSGSKPVTGSRTGTSSNCKSAYLVLTHVKTPQTLILVFSILFKTSVFIVEVCNSSSPLDWKEWPSFFKRIFFQLIVKVNRLASLEDRR